MKRLGPKRSSLKLRWLRGQDWVNLHMKTDSEEQTRHHLGVGASCPAHGFCKDRRNMRSEPKRIALPTTGLRTCLLQPTSGMSPHRGGEERVSESGRYRYPNARWEFAGFVCVRARMTPSKLQGAMDNRSSPDNGIPRPSSRAPIMPARHLEARRRSCRIPWSETHRRARCKTPRGRGARPASPRRAQASRWPKWRRGEDRRAGRK